MQNIIQNGNGRKASSLYGEHQRVFMRSPIGEPDRKDDTIKITPLSRDLENPRLSDHLRVFKTVYGKYR